jgi:hypothetical protein
MTEYGFSPIDAHKFVEILAFELWQQRGCPLGSAEVDWCAAERVLLSWVAGSRGGLPYALSAWNQARACVEGRIAE